MVKSLVVERLLSPFGKILATTYYVHVMNVNLAARDGVPRRARSGRQRDDNSQRKHIRTVMRILILNVDYQSFLEYLMRPEALRRASYSTQMQARNDSLFGVADFYSRNFKAHGHEAAEVHVNNYWMQHAWAREHGMKLPQPRPDVGPVLRHTGLSARTIRMAKSLARPLVRRIRPWRMQGWETSILDAQIEQFDPQVILNQSMEYVRSDYLMRHRKTGRVIVGQIAAPRPEGEDYRVYDLVISSLRNFVRWFAERGIRSRWNQLAFEPHVLEAMAPPPERDIPLSFVGSLSPDHRNRIAWLEALSRHTPLQVWGNGIERLSRQSPLHKLYRGEAWGRSMYDVLCRSKITLNHHIDLAEGWANNMRLYEATGMGALLLTDRQRNLNDIYRDGEEVVSYQTAEDCAATIKSLLGADAQRGAIAKAGQQRAISTNNYYRRTGEILDHIQELYPHG